VCGRLVDSWNGGADGQRHIDEEGKKEAEEEAVAGPSIKLPRGGNALPSAGG
jgi:hypothetical protein